MRDNPASDPVAPSRYRWVAAICLLGVACVATLLLLLRLAPAQSTAAARVVAEGLATLCLLGVATILFLLLYLNRRSDRARQRLLDRSQGDLKASEERYAELVEQALEGILVRKGSGEIVFANTTLCAMLGYSRAELQRMRIHDLVHAEDAETVEQVQRLAQGQHLRIAKRMLHKDGRVLFVEVSARRLANGDIQSAVHDLSDTQRAELRFRAVVEQSPIAMLMTDARGVVTMVNPQAERLFGYLNEELLGQPVEKLVPAKVRAAHPALRAGYMRELRARPMGHGRELFGLHKDGREVPVEIALNPISTRDGDFVLASIVDITQRRESERREQIYMDELRIMSQRLLEAQEEERRAIARELHDEIGQGLTATRINLERMLKEAGDGPLADQAAGASAIVSEILQQVRQLSLNLHPSVLDDLGIAAALRWLVRTRVAATELAVVMELAEGLPRFSPTVEHTVFRVFQEALSNVLRHSGARNFQVKLCLEDDMLRLHAEDDGCGFDLQAAQKHALEGASLGVIGMQERVRLVGGRIVIESQPGRGTRMQVSVPATER